MRVMSLDKWLTSPDMRVMSLDMWITSLVTKVTVFTRGSLHAGVLDIRVVSA